MRSRRTCATFARRPSPTRSEPQHQSLAHSRARASTTARSARSPTARWIPRACDGVDPDLRVRPFFAQGGTISIREFLVGAFNAEMGMRGRRSIARNRRGRRARGDAVRHGAGWRLDRIEAPPASSPAQDPDGDGVTNELPTALVDHMEFYLLNYFKPGTYRQTSTHAAGLATFNQIGCGGCHVQDLTINRDRRVADVETVYDPQRGVFNTLFATASLRLVENERRLGLPDAQVAGVAAVRRPQFLCGPEAARPRAAFPRAQLRRLDAHRVHDRAAVGRRLDAAVRA